MTTPGGGGDRLEVSVVVDATGFAAQAQAKIDAAVANVKAKIKADIDLKRLQAQTEAAAKRVAQQTKIQLQVGVDRKYLQEQIRAAITEASAERHTIKVGVDVDRGALDRVSAAGHGGSTTVNVDGDTSELRREIQEVRQTAQRNPIDVPVQIDPQSARQLGQGGRGIRAITGAMSGLQKAGFYAGLLQTLASAAVAAGGGLFAMAGAASQAFGVLAAAPNVVGIAVQALGALFAGFSGIGGAVSALGQAQAAGGGAAARGAKAQEGAAKRIEKAQKSLQRAIVDQQRTSRDGDRSVADARQKVADVYARASDRVQSAERKVADAQKGTQRAQEALNRAREQATDQLKDYQLQLSGAALDEESATLAVARAREAWNKAMRNPVSTELDRKEADLALRQAEQSLKEIQDRNKDLRAEADAATTAGVEGSAAVVGAKEDLQEATEKEVESVRDLVAERVDAARDIGDAETDLALTIEAAYEANIDAAERVADAQDAIADAMQSMADAGAAGAGGIDLVGQAMDKLSPAGRAFAEFVNGTLKPRMLEFRNAIQQQMLPGIQSALEQLIAPRDPNTGIGGYLDVLQAGLADTGKIMGDVASEAATMMSQPGFTKDTETIMASNNTAFRSFGDAGLSLVNVFRNLAVAAGPLVERFADFIARKAALLDTFVSTNRETGALAGFFERAGDRAAQLGDIVGNLLGALFGLGQGGVKTGDTLLDKFQKLTQRWNDWANSDAGQKRIEEFFENIRPLFEQIGSLIANVSELFVAIGEDGGGSVAGMVTAVNALLEALTWLFESPAGPFISTLMQFAGVAAVASLVGGSFLKMGTRIWGVGSAAVSAVTGVADFARGLRGGADAASDIGTRAAGAGAKIRDLASKASNLASTSWNGLKKGASAILDFGKKAATATIRVIATTAALVAQKAAMIAGAIATGVQTAATWLFSAALWANPITWIVLAIIGLIAVIYLLITNTWGVRDAVVAAWEWITDKVVGAAEWIKEKVVAAFDWIKDKVVGAVTWVRDKAVAAFDWIKDKVVAAAEWVRDKAVAAFEWVRDKVVAAAEWVRDRAVGAYNALRDGIVNAANWVRDRAVAAFEWVRDKIVSAAEWVRDRAVGAFEWMRDKVTGALDRVGSFASGIWDGLTNGLKAGLNAVIRLFNSGIGAVNSIIRGVNHLPGVDIGEIPRIPLLAEGAIVRRPTLAIIGEDGPEAVIPLSQQRARRRAELMEQAGLSGGEPFQAGGRAALGGWARLDTGGQSVADMVASNRGATDAAASGGDNIGTVIEEGAVVQHIHNPAPETASGTLASGLRRVAALGIFDSRPAS